MGACEAHSSRSNIAAGLGVPDTFYRWYHLAEKFCNLHFERVHKRKRDPVVQLFFDGTIYHRV
jgi:hypothetical protein